VSGRDRGDGTIYRPVDRHTQLAHDDLEALRSSVHRPPPGKRIPLLPLLLVLVITVGVVIFLQRDGILGSPSTTVTTRPASLGEQIEQQLASRGFEDITVQIDGDMVTISGYVASTTLLEEAETVVFSIDGVATVDNRLQVGTPGDDELLVRAETALVDDAYRAVVVSVRDGVVVLGGFVASNEARSAAASLVRDAGAVKIANRLVVGELPDVQTSTPEVDVSDDKLAARAAQALRDGGFSDLEVGVIDGRVTVGGVVPLGVLEQGFFDYSHRVEAAVLAVPGVTGVTTKLRLRGDEAILRSDLHTLVEASPIVFDSGSAELTAASQTTLDSAASIIVSQPGLQVFIAGYTDEVGSSEVNEQLATARAGAVYQYLILKGVPPSRLAVVSYGELFAGAGPSEQSRRIEFEVGP
jgi:outer membrane protein OmpA-like peptidoglycan-associated protein